MKTIIIVIVLLFIGCRSSRTVTIEQIPSTSVTTAIDSSIVRTPRLRSLPRAGMRISFPEAVRLYRERLEGNTFEVVEVVLTGETVTIRTPRGETQHRLPPKGETKTIYDQQADPTRPDSLAEAVEGKPEPERTTFELPKEKGFFDEFKGILKWATLLIIVIAISVLILRFRG